jgi:hypothetical protein
MEIYVAGEPKFVGAIPQRGPLLVQGPPVRGWVIYETPAQLADHLAQSLDRVPHVHRQEAS